MAKIHKQNVKRKNVNTRSLLGKMLVLRLGFTTGAEELEIERNNWSIKKPVMIMRDKNGNTFYLTNGLIYLLLY